MPLESGDKCSDLEPGEPPEGAEGLRRITGGTIRLEDLLRLLEVFNHLGEREEAAEESPGLREMLTPKIGRKNQFEGLNTKYCAPNLNSPLLKL